MAFVHWNRVTSEGGMTAWVPVGESYGPQRRWGYFRLTVICYIFHVTFAVIASCPRSSYIVIDLFFAVLSLVQQFSGMGLIIYSLDLTRTSSE